MKPLTALSFLFGLLPALFCASLYAAQNKALVIGISQYAEINNLRYADADALEFSLLLTDFAGYEKSDVTLLQNQQATKKRIVDEINKIVHESQKAPLDNFILMFAGHGVESTLTAHNEKTSGESRETNIFLAPADASTDDNNFYSTGYGKEVSNDTFINKAWLARQLSAIKAKSIFIILDSCYSGTKSFGTLFLENEGYEVQSLGTSGAQNGVTNAQKRRLRLIQSQSDTDAENRKVAYLASSRGDQTSAEYDELGHGALSYCIFEYINGIRREANDDEKKNVSIADVYTNITKLFHDTNVHGVALDVAHQPLLIPIPDYTNMKDMVFMSVQGTRKRPVVIPVVISDYSAPVKEQPSKPEVKTGILNIRTEPSGLEILVDGEKQNQVTDARLELTEGKHSIELYMPDTGYRYSFTADISPSSPLSESFSLRGQLDVASFWLIDGRKTPGPDLDVSIDGKKVGRSNLHLDNLLAGTHYVEVSYKDVTKSRQIEIRPDSPLHINYSVIREAVPVPAPVDNSGVSSGLF